MSVLLLTLINLLLFTYYRFEACCLLHDLFSPYFLWVPYTYPLVNLLSMQVGMMLLLFFRRHLIENTAATLLRDFAEGASDASGCSARERADAARREDARSC